MFLSLSALPLLAGARLASRSQIHATVCALSLNKANKTVQRTQDFFNLASTEEERQALSEYGRRFLVELLKSSNQSEPDRHVVYKHKKK
jgi:hypothetical protein